MASAIPDYYVILQVTPAATLEEIRTAYRERMKENHPDITGGLWHRYKDSGDALLLKILEQKVSQAAGMAQQINAAYQVLSDPAQRARYDRQRQAPPEPAASPPPPPRPQPAPPPRTTIYVASPTAAEIQWLQEERLINQIIALCIHGCYAAAFTLTGDIPTLDRRQRVRAFIQDLQQQQPSRSAAPQVLEASDTACPRCARSLLSARAHRALNQEIGPLLRPTGTEWWISLAGAPLVCLLLLALCSFCGSTSLNQLNTTFSVGSNAQTVPTAVRGNASASQRGSVAARDPQTLTTVPAIFNGLAPASGICLLSTGAFLVLLYQLPPLRTARRQRRRLRQLWAHTRYCPQCSLIFVGGEGRGVPLANVLNVLKEASSLA
jgi:hypothetical protein